MDDTNKVWYLHQNRLFADSAADVVEGTQGIFTIKRLPRRSQIFDQGDAPQLVYLIKRGKVKIARLTAEGKEVTVAVLGAGDIFGEEAIFTSQPRTTIATCLEETLLCISRASDLFDLVAHDSTLALNVAKVLNDRLGDATSSMEDLAYHSVSDRLLHVLERLGQEHGVQAPDGMTLDLRLTHADLASLVGSTRETVSLEMGLLTKSGRIRYDGHAITLCATSAHEPKEA